MSPLLGMFVMGPLPGILVLLILLIAGLAIASKRGLTIPVPVCVVLIIAGVLLVLAPMVCDFLLALFGRHPVVSEDERITCWVFGGIALTTGIVGALFSRRAGSGPLK